MPKSKRDKKISLTRTHKKGFSWKKQLIEDIRKCVEKYPNLFVFTVQNMRNTLLKELRSEWRQNSRIIFGKNRVMQIGLGRSEAEEPGPGLHKVSKRISGQCGLLFTEKTKEDFLEWAKHYWAIDYARSGFVATETVTLPAGSMEELGHAMEPHLRSLGMPTTLKKGIIVLHNEYTVCEKGKALTPEQAKMLKLISKPMAKFRLTIRCSWNKKDGFEEHVADNDNASDSGNEDDIEEGHDDVEMEAGNDSDDE